MCMKSIIIGILITSIIAIIINTLIYSKVERFSNSANNDSRNNKNNTTIPKKIWLFWNTPLEEAPNIVKFCLKVITKLCGDDYEINMLSLNNYKTFVDDSRITKLMENPDIAVNYKSDLIRFYLLYKYGGIYLDSSIILLKSLNWIYLDNYINKDFIIYYNTNHTTNIEKPIFESGFIAAKPQIEFTKLVTEKLIEVLNQNNLENELTKLKNDKTVNYQNFGHHGIYHIIYYIYTYIIYKHQINNFEVLKCSPNSVVCSSLFDNYDEFKKLFTENITDDKYEIMIDEKIIKFTKVNREIIKMFKIKPNSFMDKFIKTTFDNKSCIDMSIDTCFYNL